jgi:hypothetical protein
MLRRHKFYPRINCKIQPSRAPSQFLRDMPLRMRTHKELGEIGAFMWLRVVNARNIEDFHRGSHGVSLVV